MLPILTKGGPRLEVNALFFQPTRYCALECKGCYVKEHVTQINDYHIDYRVLADVFDIFYQGKRAYANQITIAVDNLPLPKDSFKARVMIEFLSLVWGSINQYWDDVSPEVHWTIHTPSTLYRYLHSDSAMFDFTRYLKMLSISNIPILSDLYTLRKQVASSIPFNYNHLIPANVSSHNIDSYVEKMTQIGSLVDSIYLVIFKRPIQDKLVKIGDVSRMRRDMAYIGTMLERLPSNVRDKVHIDGCLEDTIKFSRTGFGCSSNVSRFQIWPDGSVTGCPYAFGANLRPSRTADDILENIRAAQERYEFREWCHLPNVYNNVKEGRADQESKL